MTAEQFPTCQWSKQSTEVTSQSSEEILGDEARLTYSCIPGTRQANGWEESSAPSGGFEPRSKIAAELPRVENKTQDESSGNGRARAPRIIVEGMLKYSILDLVITLANSAVFRRKLRMIGRPDARTRPSACRAEPIGRCQIPNIGPPSISRPFWQE